MVAVNQHAVDGDTVGKGVHDGFKARDLPCHEERLVRCPQEANPLAKRMGKKHSPRFLNIVNDAREQVSECDAGALRDMLADGQELVVLDVRERHEFEAGHLEGAIHIGKGVIERDIEKQDFADDLRLVLYCGGGYRSAIAAKSLQDMGYRNVISLWGGWRGIQAEGLPIWTP